MKIKIGSYEITTGTAIAVTAGSTERQPAIFVHLITDEFADGDCVVFDVRPEDLTDADEEHIADLLSDYSYTSMDYNDLTTFEVDA